jgi:small subunit ribosomal protein S16
MRLKRFGTKQRPYYRIVVMDSRQANKSRTLAEVGQYHPVENKVNQVVVAPGVFTSVQHHTTTV